MSLSGPSWTSRACARSRALHMRLDGKPWIYEDRLAADLVDLDGHIADGFDLEVQKLPHIRSTRAAFVLRERYVEDELAKMVATGPVQYVVLGAGMNTFAHCHPEMGDRVHVFEVDHPETQTWKRKRLAEIGRIDPENLTYVPVDFETQQLGPRLYECGFNPQKTALFGWLGVTQYLHEQAVLETFSSVARLAAPGSRVIVQGILKPELVPEQDRIGLERVIELSAENGEPWLSFQDPVELAEFLLANGYSVVNHFRSEEATEWYFSGRDDGLRPAGYQWYVNAVVGG